MTTTQTSFRYPDFFIVGAMKCGTTTMHHALCGHPDIRFLSGEPRFFAVDDYELLPELVFTDERQWGPIDFTRDTEAIHKWYKGKYPTDVKGKLLGEDSAAYLASTIVPTRIREANPNARFIVMLRDPVQRTYSHYWHLVHTGRAEYSFEEQIRSNPGGLLTRSYYYEQLSHYLRFFKRDNFHIVVFEQFIKEPVQSLNEVVAFLGLAPFSPTHQTLTPCNTGKYPRSLRLALLRNWLLRRHSWSRDFDDLPLLHRPRMRPLEKAVDLLHRRLNTFCKGTAPTMPNRAREYLSRLFALRNAGLDELVGVDLRIYWKSLRI